MLALDETRPARADFTDDNFTDIGLAGVSYVSGPCEPIGMWCEGAGLNDSVARDLACMGLGFVAREPHDRAMVLAGCMHAAVQRAGLRSTDIAAVCFAPPSFEWSRALEAELFGALAETGLQRLPVVGLGLQGCSAIGAAVETGTALALRRQGPVLLVLSALPEGGARYDAASARLFGCGAACAVIGRGLGANRLLSAAWASDAALAAASLAQSGPGAFQPGWQLLREVIAQALAEAGCEARDVSFLCGSNVNQPALAATAMAAGVPRDRIWSGGLRELGHLYSADGLIALAHLEESGRLRGGERILVAEWSDFTASAVVLERCLPRVAA